MFDHPVSSREASKCLLALNQGSHSTADFAIEFQTIVAGSEWSNEALMVCFQGGLSEPLQDELATREPAADFESLIAMAIRLGKSPGRGEGGSPRGISVPSSCEQVCLYSASGLPQPLNSSMIPRRTCSWVVPGSLSTKGGSTFHRLRKLL